MLSHFFCQWWMLKNLVKCLRSGASLFPYFPSYLPMSLQHHLNLMYFHLNLLNYYLLVPRLAKHFLFKRVEYLWIKFNSPFYNFINNQAYKILSLIYQFSMMNSILFLQKSIKLWTLLKTLKINKSWFKIFDNIK